MVLGSFQTDTMQRMTGEVVGVQLFYYATTNGVYSLERTDKSTNDTAASNGSSVIKLQFDNARSVRTSAENRPKATSLNYYIYVY